MHLRYYLITVATTCLFIYPSISQQAQVRPENLPLIKAAIFTQNRAGKEFNEKLNMFNDLITARLSEKGFSIINKNDVLAKFKEVEGHEVDRATLEAIRLVTILYETNDGGYRTSLENTINEASALRISQMIGADCLIIASINSAGQEHKKFHGQGTIVGTDIETTVHSLRVAIKVLEGNEGGTIYGDVVTVSETIGSLKSLEIISSDIINKLLDRAATKIAENISARVERNRTANVQSEPKVEFIETNFIDVPLKWTAQ